MLKIFITSSKFTSVICNLFGIDVFTVMYFHYPNVKLENLVSDIRLLKWLLVSLNTERLHSASTDMASRVHTNTSKILMFGQESGSANTKDFSNASSQSALLDCLDHLLNHLDTTLSNDLGVIRSLCHYSNCSGEGIPSLIIKDGTRLRKALTGQQLSAEKWYCNCCSKLSIKWMPIYLL